MGKFVLEITDGDQEITTIEADRAELLLAQTKDTLRERGLISHSGVSHRVNAWNFHLETQGPQGSFTTLDAYSQRLRGELIALIATQRERDAYALDGIRAIQSSSRRNGFVLMDGSLPKRSLFSGLHLRLKCIDALAKGNCRTPAVEREKQRAQFGAEEPFDAIADQYESIRVDEGIDDAKLRRLCAVMHESGLQTHHSCEGHGDELPEILFEPVDQDALHILDTALQTKLRLPWTRKPATFGMNDREARQLLKQKRFAEAGRRIQGFSLEPEDQYCLHTSAAERYDNAILDLDLIGLRLAQALRQRKEEV